jgi:hypothetical protein
MRVLTVRQPWAWAILHGGKDVENRVRSLGPYRGPVAIHASSHIAGRRGERTLFEPGLEVERDQSGLLLRAKGIWPYRLPLGCILGVVDLVDTHDEGECLDLSIAKLSELHQTDPAALRALPDNGLGGVLGRARLCSKWAMPDHHHLVLENPRPLARPIPVKGRLGLWRPDAELEAAILAGLGGA